jgi:hypothetical protein
MIVYVVDQILVECPSILPRNENVNIALRDPLSSSFSKKQDEDGRCQPTECDIGAGFYIVHPYIYIS